MNRLEAFQKLKNVARDRKLSMRQWAQLSGVSPGAINHYKNGRNGPKESTLKKLAMALNIDLEIEVNIE